MAKKRRSNQVNNKRRSNQVEVEVEVEVNTLKASVPVILVISSLRALSASS
jgi:hypothetical protein